MFFVQWKLEHFSSLPEKIESEVFEAGGYRWSLLLFPRGNANNLRERNAMSLYLKAVSEHEEESKRSAEFKLFLLNQLYPEKHIEKPSCHTFENVDEDWGFNQFGSLADLADPSLGYCVDDTVVLRVRVRITVQEDLLLHDSRRETGFVGLKNQGATCYMNSLLQTLYNINEFRKAVYHMPTSEDEDPSASMPLAMQSVFYKLQFTPGPVSTEDLTRAFGWDTMDAFQQQDVQELKALLSDRLEEKMKGTRVEGAINRLFEGRYLNYISCINVDYKSEVRDTFHDLQLNVRGCPDIYASLDKLCEVETLDGDNCYEAEGHGKQPARKGTLFDTLPPVLSFHLKRFDYDWQRDMSIKINDKHEFYEDLDLDRVDENGNYLYLSPNADRSVSHKYKLLAVLVHSGGTVGGHYFAYMRPNGKQWLKFDDEIVTKVQPVQAIEENWGSGDERAVGQGYGAQNMRPSLRFANAYMLVYIRQSEWDTIMCEVTEDDIEAHVRARLKAEQEELERRKRERAEAHLYALVRVVSDEDLKKTIGVKRHFDLVDFNSDNLTLNLKVRQKAPFEEVQKAVERQIGIPPHRQRFRQWVSRQNQTYRPHAPLTYESPEQSISSLLTRRGGAQGHYAKLDLYLETLPENMTEFLDSKKTNLLFIKQYIPGYKQRSPELKYLKHLSVMGSMKIGDLLPALRKLGNLPSDAPLLVFEEVKFNPNVRLEELMEDTSLNENKIENGDILIFQQAIAEEEEQDYEYPSAKDYLEWIRQRINVKFFRMEAGQPCDIQENPPFTLLLTWDMTYDDVSAAVSKHLNLDHPLKLQFTQQSRFQNSPTTHPIPYPKAAVDPNMYPNRQTLVLERMLQSRTSATYTGAQQTEQVLYYEILDVPLPEYENLLSHRIAFHNNQHEEVAVVSIRIPRHKTVNDLLNEVKAALPDNLVKEIGDAPLRLMEIYQWKIWQVFNPEEIIDVHMGPSKSVWHLRAEVIPEDQRDLTNPGSLHVHCLHVESKEGSPKTPFAFNDPFIMSIGPDETIGALKKRVKESLQVSDEEFSSWKVVLVTGIGNHTMEDMEDDVVIAQKLNPVDMDPARLYGHRERPCIGFFHKNTNTRKTMAHLNFNRALSGADRALKIRG